MEGTTPTASVPAVPRPAATVALLRDGASGIDVWLMRRHAAMAFAAGMHAFPGGAVEPADEDPELDAVWHGRGPAEFGAVFGVEPATARALVSAAVRETFEECGLLCASGDLPDREAAEAARVGLLDGSVGWSALLHERRLAIDAAALVPWARWITPSWSPRRFDAFFFLADAGALGGSVDGPRWIDGEADRADWFGVADAIAAHERGELPMLPPTITTLRQVAAHATVADALAAYPRRIEEEAG